MDDMDMGSSFHFSQSLTNFVFYGWNSQTVIGIVGTCLAVGSLAVIVEFLTWLQRYLNRRAHLNPLEYGRTEENINERSPLLAPLIIPPSIQHIKNRLIKYHVFQTLVYTVTRMAGYILMLAVMSYNAYVGITIALAAGLGYLVFGAYRDIIDASQATHIQTDNQDNTSRDSIEHDVLHSRQPIMS